MITAFENAIADEKSYQDKICRNAKEVIDEYINQLVETLTDKFEMTIVSAQTKVQDGYTALDNVLKAIIKHEQNPILSVLLEQVKGVVEKSANLKDVIMAKQKEYANRETMILQELKDLRTKVVSSTESMNLALSKFESKIRSIYSSLVEKKTEKQRPKALTDVERTLKEGKLVDECSFENYTEVSLKNIELQINNEIKKRAIADEDIMLIGEQYVLTLQRALEANQVLVNFSSNVS